MCCRICVDYWNYQVTIIALNCWRVHLCRVYVFAGYTKRSSRVVLACCPGSLPLVPAWAPYRAPCALFSSSPSDCQTEEVKGGRSYSTKIALYWIWSLAKQLPRWISNPLVGHVHGESQIQTHIFIDGAVPNRRCLDGSCLLHHIEIDQSCIHAYFLLFELHLLN